MEVQTTTKLKDIHQNHIKKGRNNTFAFSRHTTDYSCLVKSPHIGVGRTFQPTISSTTICAPYSYIVRHFSWIQK